MGAIFSYSLASSIVLIMLYIAYRFTMAGEKQFAINRIMIYAIYATALLAPISYHIIKGIRWNEAPSAEVAFDIEPEIFTAPAVQLVDEAPSLLQFLLWIYMVGVVVVSIRLAVSITMLFVLAYKKGNRRLENGYILVITDDRKFSPFSFLRYIVISREDYEKSLHEILIHELTHLRKNHWIDQMIGNLIAIFQWYNPAAWLMIEELKSVHEYQADEAVIESGTDMRHYQYLLIEKAVGKRFPSPANSLNHSKLKKRVTMMYKSKPSAMRRLAGIAVIPAAIVALAITDIPAVAEVISETEDAKLMAVLDGKVSDFSEDEQIKVDTEATDEPIQVIAVGAMKKADAPESEVAGMVKILEDVPVGAKKSPDSYDNPNTAQAEVFFDDDTDYYLDGEKSTRDVVNGLDPAVIASIDVKKNTPRNEIRVNRKNPDASTANKSSEEVYVQVEDIPEFPGGMNEMLKFLSNNVRYPEDAHKNNVQGRVIVKFIVSANGKVTDPVIVRGVDSSLDQEALRVVNSMPDWKPGMVNGTPVSCYFTLPINFKLQDNTKEKEKTE